MILQRHFVFKHPLFRKKETSSGIEWQKSIYYLWWEFLCRHDGYKKTCESAGNGRYAKLYKDFGNVHSGDFKQWWTRGERGARLFAEPALPNTVVRLTKDDLAKLGQEWTEDALLILAVPLSLPKRYLQGRLAQMLKTYHPRRRGNRLVKDSRAMYKITNQFNLHGLQVALAVYDLKKANPKMKLWEIAQQLRFSFTLNPDEFDLRGRMAFEANRKKKTMSVAASRKLYIARNIIDGVGRGVFPKYKP